MKKTKFAYKVVKDNRKSEVAESKISEGKKEKNPVAAALTAVVSFILVSKVKLCFRECAKIVKVAEETGCVVEIASGTKSGTSESILSLANLGIVEDKSLVLTIRGEHNEDAFRKISKIINGTAEEE